MGALKKKEVCSQRSETKVARSLTSPTMAERRSGSASMPFASSYEQMQELLTVIGSIDDFSSENTEKVVKQWVEEKEYGLGLIMNAFRLLIVGALKGPHLFHIVALIGKDETLNRMDYGVQTIGRKEA